MVGPERIPFFHVTTTHWSSNNYKLFILTTMFERRKWVKNNKNKKSINNFIFPNIFDLRTITTYPLNKTKIKVILKK